MGGSLVRVSVSGLRLAVECQRQRLTRDGDFVIRDFVKARQVTFMGDAGKVPMHLQQSKVDILQVSETTDHPTVAVHPGLLPLWVRIQASGV